MTDQERLVYAKKYVEQMANGINPLNQQPIAEQDLLNNVHISRCLFFVSDVLQSVIENTTANRQNEKEVPGCSISQMNRSKHYNRQNMTCLLVI